MSNDTVPPAAANQVEKTSKMNFLQRLAGIYFEPTTTFKDINRKSSWLGIFIITSVLIVASTYVIRMRMDYETYIRKAIQLSPFTSFIPEEQIDAMASQPPSAWQNVSVLLTPVSLLATYALIAAIFLLLFIMMGSPLTFRKSFAVTLWGLAPPAIVLMILNIVLVFLRHPTDLEINPADNVASNLALLVSRTEQPVLYSLLGSIDIFSFWTIALLSIGFVAISDRRLTIRKAATGIIILWLIWVLGKAGFYALFS